MKTAPPEPRVTVDYPRDAVLTVKEVARGLGVSVRQVERMDLPAFYMGPRTRRFRWGKVLDTLDSRAA